MSGKLGADGFARELKTKKPWSPPLVIAATGALDDAEKVLTDVETSDHLEGPPS